VKVKVGHPGTIVDYLGVIRIPRVSGSGWAGLCEYLAGSTLTFLEVEALLSLLICGVFFVSIS
jgi:hypothetical protein